LPRIRPLHLILALIALAAIALPLAVIRWAPPPPPPRPKAVARPKTVVPPTVLPDVEPVEYQNLAPADARALNAGVPFVADGVEPARPYRMLGGADEVARATDCLAAAAFYEAGDDAVGEQAVAQVVLNRLRHPAFPKSVCGVVFQGAERATGCQFTFTCDGALRRTPSEAAWRRAREIASRALSGHVDKTVGLATHYHTDWVVPYWSSSLDKIAEVHTHLFFRWTGWWGTRPAFNRTPLLAEPPIGKLAFLSDAHKLGAALADADGAVLAATPFFGRTAMPLPSEPNTFITSLNPAQADTFAAMAQASCGERERCKFMGWTDVEAMPFTAAMSPQQMAAMSFSYLRDRGANLERTLWNCREFKRAAGQCMKRAEIRMAPPPPPVVEEEPARGPAELEGVRRKPAPVPEAAATNGGSSPSQQP
jgi:spore germination cell wall hydrolase CwlJ-like protein